MDRTTAAAILGIGLHATTDEVEAAFRRIARRSHPDAGGDRSSFERLVEARGTMVGHSLGPAWRTAPPLVVVADETWWRRLLAAVDRRPSPSPRRHLD